MERVIHSILSLAMFVFVIVATVGAWAQHFITTVTNEMWVLMVIGAIIPPIGMVHGWLVWIGIL